MHCVAGMLPNRRASFGWARWVPHTILKNLNGMGAGNVLDRCGMWHIHLLVRLYVDVLVGSLGVRNVSLQVHGQANFKVHVFVRRHMDMFVRRAV